jgi:elongation factor Ts
VSEITAKAVQALRQETGAGMMDAKRALEEAGGDAGRAQEILREKGIAAAGKRAGREQTEGTIGHYLHFQSDHPVIGVIVELACETDFVAKSVDFQDVANGLALHVSWAQPDWLTIEDVDEEALDYERKMIEAQARNEGKPDHIIEKIVEGRLASFYKDRVLSEQLFVNAEKFEGTVGAMVRDLAVKMGENVGIRRYARFKVGESDE